MECTCCRRLRMAWAGQAAVAGAHGGLDNDCDMDRGTMSNDDDDEDDDDDAMRLL